MELYNDFINYQNKMATANRNNDYSSLSSSTQSYSNGFKPYSSSNRHETHASNKTNKHNKTTSYKKSSKINLSLISLRSKFNF